MNYSLKLAVLKHLQEQAVQIEDPIDQTDSSQNELLILAQNIPLSGAINLLQGSFRRRTASSKNWLIWKLPTIAAGIFVLMLVSLWSLDYWLLNKKMTALKQAQVEVYKKAFPGDSRVIRPVSQMRGKMNLLGKNATSGAFLPLLNKFASALAAVENTQITNINFRAKKGELKIAFLAPDFATIQKLQAELKAQQLIVTPGASNAAGEQYSGRLTIKENN
jgi:general secretion pathway protein L